MLVACLVFYVMDLDYILCVSLCSPSATVLVICGMILVLFIGMILVLFIIKKNGYCISVGCKNILQVGFN